MAAFAGAFHKASGIRTLASVEAAHAVRRGLSPKTVFLLRERLDLTQDEVSRLIMPMRTLQRRAKEGLSLTVDESDRVYRVARIAERAEAVFADGALAKQWLRRPTRALAGEAPLSLLDTEAGARLVEEQLEGIAHGIAA